MFSYIWPLALIVLSNVIYQICTKSVPENLNTFASLVVTYAIATVSSLVLFLILGKNTSLFGELGKINIASILLGFSVVGLETGFFYAYKAGWPISTLQIVQAAILAIILIFVGFFAYKENMAWNKLVGIIVCLIGLALINMK